MFSTAESYAKRHFKAKRAFFNFCTVDAVRAHGERRASGAFRSFYNQRQTFLMRAASSALRPPAGCA